MLIHKHTTYRLTSLGIKVLRYTWWILELNVMLTYRTVWYLCYTLEVETVVLENTTVVFLLLLLLLLKVVFIFIINVF